MNKDRIYMKRCLDLAKLGEGMVAPNPMVGSVVVHNNKIIGEGYHQKYGEAHAEVNAINSVKDKSLLSESTIYVSLEPCAHYGKTPPCADLIVRSRIPKVVVGIVDPFAKVAGKGIAHMTKNGCDVKVGVMEEECLEINRRFFTFHARQRPFIILKWAETADGYVDVNRQSMEFGQPTWITNEMARIAVHKQRSTEAAIFIGTNTALKDNPSLTLRDWAGNQPLRLVADRYRKIPTSHHLFDQSVKTKVFTSNTKKTDDKNQLEFVEVENEVIPELLEHLYVNDIQSVIVEGGPKMLQSFIDQGLWDEAHVYIGQVVFGDGISAPKFDATPNCFDRFYNSELRVFRNS